MSKPLFELADIIKEYRTPFIEKHPPLTYHLKVLNAIEHCRTAYMGGHVDQCNSCSHIRISYNSCRNRHCPKCQSANRERWIESREADLLPVTYFHVVFTLPHELNTFCMQYPKEFYNILFEASKETIETLGTDPKHLGAQTGMISVLHTWGQNLMLHPHVHMIVPGGGVTKSGEWKDAKSDGAYLFPEKVMSKMYRGKFMEKILALLKAKGSFMQVPLRRKLYNLNWVVYCKDPFLGPRQVIEYLGRYTHKIAISNHRIKNVSDGIVTFSYKDYAHGSVQKLMRLNAAEFLRRFCLHILPPGFMKMRHYGFLASRNKPKLKVLQLSMGVSTEKKPKRTWQEISSSRLNFDVDACPCCKTGKMIRILSFEANAPPIHFIAQIKKRLASTVHTKQ
jgi:hypothetical protein